MILGSIGRSLVRLFRRPATSVPPRIEPLPPWPWVDPAQRGAEPDLTGPSFVREVGTQPPADPTIDRPWLWSEWVRERARFNVRGWSYCRFPIRFPEDRMTFVFGSVRGQFGIYPAPFTVHYTETATAEDMILPCLVHLRGGVGMGLFGGLDAARQAAEIASKIADWNNVDPEDAASWPGVRNRLDAVWGGIGIIAAVNAYATAKNDQGGMPWAIYGISSEKLMAGKPEKLS